MGSRPHGGAGPRLRPSGEVDPGGVITAVSPSTRGSAAETSEIEFEIAVAGRWDAVALSDLLAPFHSFLVQYGPERWVICGRAPGSRGEPLGVALAEIARWRTERSPSAAVSIAGGRRDERHRLSGAVER
jgi:hypothetical protein